MGMLTCFSQLRIHEDPGPREIEMVHHLADPVETGPKVTKEDPGPAELGNALLEHIFSFLSANDLVLSIKPLNKAFRQYVIHTLESKANRVHASADVPPWALPSLGATRLTNKLKKQVMYFAAKGGCLTTLRWVRQQGCPWDRSFCKAAAQGGHLAVLQWLRQEGCPFNCSTCEAAARGGHLEMLQWAFQNGCQLSMNVCSEAAASGKLGVLQCARSHGCPWDERSCAAAAGNGDLLMLQWARRNGCIWNDRTMHASSKRRSLRGAAVGLEARVSLGS
jgi:hypothetical protein